MNKETSPSALTNGIPEMLDILRAAEKKCFGVPSAPVHLNLEQAGAYGSGQNDGYIKGRTEERELQLKFFGWATNSGYAFSYDLDKWFDANEHEDGISTSELFDIFLNEPTK